MKFKVDRVSCLLVLLGPVFVILLIEIGLRLLKPPITFTISTPCLVQEDAQTGYRFRPLSSGRLQQYNEIDNWIAMNSLGFHDIEHDLTLEQSRILVLGDSFTAATQVPVVAGWTQIVEHELRNTAVINLGVDGYGTDRQLKLLEYYAPILEPDIVILAFYENDIQDILADVVMDCYEDYLLVYQTNSQKQQLITFLDNHKPTPIAYWLSDHSSLYRVMAMLLTENGFLMSQNGISPQNINVPLEPLTEPQSEIVLELFSQFEILAQKHQFEIYIMPVPGKYDPDSSLATLEQYMGTTKWSHIQIIDVYPIMKNQFQADGRQHTDLYFVYDGHFNAYGYALFGQAVANALQQEIYP